MDVEGNSGDPHNGFFNELVKRLKEEQQADIGLVLILEAHLLTLTPTDDAVGQAKDAILKLAAERAIPAKSEVASE
jgi:hypothetical protein